MIMKKISNMIMKKISNKEIVQKNALLFHETNNISLIEYVISS